MQVINGAGHHVYADRSEIFNKHVNEACGICDRNGDTLPIKEEPKLPDIPGPSILKMRDTFDTNSEFSHFDTTNKNT